MRKLINLFENDYDNEALLYENLAKIFSGKLEAVIFFKSEDILLKLFMEFDGPLDNLEDEFDIDEMTEQKDYQSMIDFFYIDEEDNENDSSYESYIIKLQNQILTRIKPLFADNLVKINPDEWIDPESTDFYNKDFNELHHLHSKILLATDQFQKIYGNVNPLKHMSVADLLDSYK